MRQGYWETVKGGVTESFARGIKHVEMLEPSLRSVTARWGFLLNVVGSLAYRGKKLNEGDLKLFLLAAQLMLG